MRFIEPQTTLEAHTSRRAPSGQTQGPRRARGGNRFPGLEALPPAAPARSMDWQKWGRGIPGRRVDAGEQASRASRLEAARSKTLKTGSDSSRPRPCRRHNSSQPPRDRHDERGLDRARLRGRAPGAPNAGSTGPGFEAGRRERRRPSLARPLITAARRPKTRRKRQPACWSRRRVPASRRGAPRCA